MEEEEVESFKCKPDKDSRLFWKWKEQQLEQSFARIKGKDTAKQPGSHWTQPALGREERRHKNKEARNKTSGTKQEYAYQIKSVHPNKKAKN